MTSCRGITAAEITTVVFRHHFRKQFALSPIETLILDRWRIRARPAHPWPPAEAPQIVPRGSATCSLVAWRVSYADVTAPRRRAVSDCLQSSHSRADHKHSSWRDIVPAAVVSIGKIRGNVSAARITAL